MAKNKIVVVIAGDNQLSQVLKQAEGSVSDFGATASRMGSILKGAAVAAAIATVTSKIIDLGMKSIESAENFNKLAQKTGISVEALSGLAHGAKMADVEIDGLESGLKLFSKAIADAAAGSKEQENAFRALGISVRDAQGNLKPTEALLREVADAFAGSEDGATKAAIALKLFGRSGTELIPWLNQGAAGFDRMQAQARRLGVELSGETAAAAEEFNDSLKLLRTYADGFAMSLVKGLLPSLQAFAERADDAVQSFAGFKDVATAVSGSLKVIASAFFGVTFGIQAAILKFKEWDARLGNPNLPPESGVQRDKPGESPDIEKYRKEFEDTVNRFGRLWDAMWGEGEGANGGKGGGSKGSDKKKKQLQLVQEQAEATAKALTQLRAAQAKNEIDLARDSAERQLRELQYGKDRQLISIRDFYAQKKQVQLKAIDDEMRLLIQQLDAADARAAKSTGPDNLKATQEGDEIFKQIELKKRERAAVERDVAREEKDARRDFAAFALDIENEIRAAKGETAAAATAAIAREIAEKKRALQAEGVDTSGLDELQKMRTAAAEAAELGSKINAVFDELDIKLREVWRVMGQATEGEKAANEVRAEAAARLAAMVEKYGELAVAAGSPELLASHDRLKQSIKELSTQANELRDSMLQSIASSGSSAFAEWVTGAKKAGQAFADFVRGAMGDLARMAAKMLFVWAIGKLIGMFTGGAFTFNGVGIVKRAMGGPFSAGQPMLVGEGGPELIVPGSSGTVIPNHKLGGGGGGGMTLVQNIDARGATPGERERLELWGRGLVQDAVEQSLSAFREMQRRGYA